MRVHWRLVSLLMVVVVVPATWSIKCWVCRSDSDPKCADPFDNSTVPITDCTKEPYLPHLPGVRPTMCRKIRQKVNGEWRYIRSCAYMGEPGLGGDERFCIMRTGTYNIFLEYCTCNSKDGCNSAISHKSHSAITILLIALATFMSAIFMFKV
ncbi:crooked [Arctopsyche grandis]|uniref:crooked n=1 Tax=Arctopsyche grandis TaxID=121162 RepID=UPI00406D85E5